MEHKNALAVVLAWQEAANDRQVERLVDLSDPEIEIVGPRGAGRGRQLLRDWLDRALVRFETQRSFVRDDLVVIAQHGVWRDPATGAPAGEADLASAFRVEGRRVARFARYDDLDAALAATGLTAADEIPVATAQP